MATDNAVARFLFAILKQKDLKDIDWNKVAQDPVLPQPISNGHAARMRYSRFRNSMLGHESQRRNRTNNPKPPRVVKRKKGNKAVKSEEDEDSHADLFTSPVLKQEGMFIAPSRSTAMGSNNPSRAHNRLLTPCSDSETALTTPHGYSPSPAPEVQRRSSAFDFTGAGTAPAHEAADPWQSYTGFATEFNIDNFTTAFNQPDQHTAEALSLHASMMEHDRSHGHDSMVKREEWDTASVDNQHYHQGGIAEC